MVPQAAVEIMHRRHIAEAPDPGARRAQLHGDYVEQQANPWVAAERGYVDDVIEPALTRPVLVKGLAMLRSKQAAATSRKHGNVPL
jgi:propionyl-CoA carboxylase beta chain